MLAALFLNAVMFSARSFQHYVAQVAPETGGVIRLAEIERVGEEVKALELTMAPLVGAAAQADASVAQLTADLDRTRSELNATQAQIMASVDRLESEAGAAPAAATSAYDDISLTQRLDALLANRTAPAAVRASIPAVKAAIAQANVTESNIAALTDKAAAAANEQARAGETVVQARSQIVQRQSAYGAEFSRIIAEAQALKASSPLGIGKSFAEMHPVFLSTVLVCVMGALGAILYLFPLYMVPNAQVYLRDIVVRLVFGMATALAFYIVANATLAGFSLSSQGQQAQSVGANLNPFTVSLLGIIAGVMADDIAKWILERGRQLLGGNAGSGLAPSIDPASAPPMTSGPAVSGPEIDPNTGRPL